MGLRELTDYWIDGRLADITGQTPTPVGLGEWALPEAGRVRVVGGTEDAWVEVLHTAAADVVVGDAVIEALAAASLDSPVTAVLVDDAVVARHVFHAHDPTEAALFRALSATYSLASTLCERVVNELGAGTCATSAVEDDAESCPPPRHHTDASPEAESPVQPPASARSSQDLAVPSAGYL